MKRHTKTTINTILAAFALLAATGCHNQNALTEKTAAKQGPAAAATVAMNGETAGVSTPAVANARPAAGLGGRVVGSKYVTTAATDTVAADDVMLLIDSGAVRRDVQISIVSTTEEHTGEIPSHMENLTAGGAVYRMLPDGQKFEKDITIAMRYDSTALPHGYTAEDIYTFFYNEDTRMWQKVERDSVDTQHQIVYSRTNHFTDYINGVLKVPESSDATSYTPTSIKDLKAADPLEGITLMAPPEANNMGTANLSYPLTLPAGRHGMQPQLSVNYNSAGGSGILGLGWSMPISEISVETRWGVPLFDSHLQTEGYVLDGTTLVSAHTDDLGNFRLDKPVYHRQYEARDLSGRTRFFPRVEGSFRRIERFQNTPRDYYWVVTDKDGTCHYYGQTAQARLTDKDGNIAKWMLEKSVDTYGNTVKYTYMTKTEAHSGERAGRQLCIRSIQYTGNERTNESGQYLVRFTYTDKYDKATSFRYGLEEINNYLLDKIQIMFGTEIVREYFFGYRKGTFGKTLLCNIIEGYDDEARSQVYEHSDNPKYSSTIHDASAYERCGLEFSKREDYVYYHLFHSFDYFDLEGNDIFDSPQLFDVGWTGNTIVDVFSNALYEHNHIGGNASAGFDVYGAINVGTDYLPFLKTISAGGHYSFSKDWATSFMTIVDVDGDGYPDKLFRDLAGNLKCRRQIPGQNKFGNAEAVHGVNKIQSSSTNTHNWGFEASVLGPISGGANWSDSRSTTSVYLTDVNGDGLPDIVDNGSVYLNQGNLHFANVTESTVIPVGGTCENDVFDFSGELNTSIFDDGYYVVEREVCDTKIDSVEVFDTLYDANGKPYYISAGYVQVVDNEQELCHTVYDTFYYTYPRRYEPNIDLVRMWKAPYKGTVRISGHAKLSDSLADYRAMTRTEDGVWVSVHKANDTSQFIASTTVKPGDDKNITGEVNVNEGDTIYFRINSGDKRLYDEVEWNPHIKYVSARLRNNTTVSSANLQALSSTGDSVYAFDYGTDFMIDGIIPVSMGDTTGNVFDNNYEVRTSIRSNVPLSQPVIYALVKKDLSTSGNETIVRVDTLPTGDISEHYYNTPITVASNQSLFLRLFTQNYGQVRWSGIDVRDTVRLVSSGSSMIASHLADTNMRKTYVWYPAVDRTYNDYLAIPGATFSGLSNINKIKITTTPNTYNGSRWLTIKKASDNTVVYQGFLQLNTNGNPVSVSLNPSERYYVDCYFADPAEGSAIKNLVVRFNNNTNCQAGMYTKYTEDIDKHHGTLYRGWGQFGYKSDDSGALFINNQLTHAPAYYTDTNAVPHPDDNTINDFDTNAVMGSDTPELDLGGDLFNPLAGSFFEMNADGANDRWISYGNAVSASRTLCVLDNEGNSTSSQYATGDPELDALANGPDMFQSPVPVVIPGQPMKAVNKMVLTKGNGWTVLRISHNHGRTRLLGDYMDLNGDRYPDAVSEKEIQYSKAQGGLSSLTRGYSTNDDGINRTDNYSIGHAFNGTFINAQPEPASNPKTARTVHTTHGQSAVGVTPPSINSGSFSFDRTENTLLDLNGDGLPDILYSDGGVRYNMGYRFTSRRSIPIQEIRNSISYGGSGGVGVNISNTSISGGLSANLSENITQFALMDINGDGLQDRVFPGASGSIQIARGDGTYEPHAFNGTLMLDKSNSMSFSLNVGATYDGLIVIVFFPIKFGGTLSAGGTASLTWTGAEFADMNNDGYVDYVTTDPILNQVWVRYSRIGKTNLLRTVDNFAGASYSIDYELDNSNTQNPQRHWKMSSLKVYDGYSGDGESTMYKRFTYGNRVYDRYERDDYGYSSVETKEFASQSSFSSNSGVARFHREQYVNSDYYNSHRKVYERVSDGNKYADTRYTYKDADIADGHYLGSTAPWCEGDGWPALSSEETMHYEGSGTTINTLRNYIYDSYGNVKYVEDMGDVNDPTDDYTVKLTYDLNPTSYIVANVKTLDIPSYRHRRAAYNTEGSLVKLSVDNSPNSPSDYAYKYDAYGNVTMVETPALSLSTSTRYSIKYKYDPMLHMLPIMVSNSEGHQSTAQYSYRWQLPTLTTDIHGEKMRYDYDSHGRTIRVTGPNELGGGNNAYTVKYDHWYSRLFRNPAYSPITNPHGIPYYFWTRTRNYDPEHPGNDINTVTFSDGLGRIIQVKKDVDLGGGAEYRAVGGKVHYDALGRKTEEYFLVQENSFVIGDTLLNTDPASIKAEYSYDYLDRVVKTHYADNTYSLNQYTIDADDSGIPRFRTDAIDQNGHTSIVYNDARGQNSQVTDALGNTTVFEYDAIGQLWRSTDPEGNVTKHFYDMGGRRISRDHPSAGTTTWDYDQAGNVLQMTQNSGESINYVYDYMRLMEVKYSDRPWNNAKYEYGPAGSGSLAGRLLRQQDASGVQEFGYDAMGNIAYNRHTYVQPHSHRTLTLDTKWKYDSWGRVQVIIYPDREVVEYEYDLGGNLRSIEGYKNGDGYTTYIKELTYDLYEQRVRQITGNGVVTRYSYDPATRRLASLRDNTGSSYTLQDNTYTYDNVGNVIAINDGGLNPRSQSYNYDDANRLVASTGTMTINGSTLNYTSDYNYSPAGRMMRKTVNSQRVNNAMGIYPVNYSNNYSYGYSNPFAVRSITESISGNTSRLKWDANGNLEDYSSSTNAGRHLCWTEDNRLQGYYGYSREEGEVSAWYNYTAGGERNLKITSPQMNMQQNAQTYSVSSLVYPTLYASSLITISKYGYTKHYFEGSNRICSKIGGGFRNVSMSEIDGRVPELDVDYDNLYSMQEHGVHRTFNDCLGIGVDMDNTVDLHQIIKYEQNRPLTHEPAFYYHSDHLGSAAYLTNENGQVTQTLNYLPYGEDWADIQNQAETQYPMLGIYNYNGKEKDYESGFHYYGARYYWSELLSGWLSVDPMMDKYPGMSPYNFCAWNPVRFIDPDGNEALENTDWVKKKGTNQYIWLDYVHNEATTPTGYDYVGHEDKDILKDMGIPENFNTQQASRVGATSKWRPPAVLGIIFGNRKNESTARLSARAHSITNSKFASQSNKEGRVFTGITFTASVTQVSISVDEGWGGMKYNGGLSIEFADGTHPVYDYLTTPKGDQLNAPHHTTTEATCTVSAQQIKSRGVPTAARITMGYCNPGSMNRAIEFNWKL